MNAVRIILQVCLNVQKQFGETMVFFWHSKTKESCSFAGTKTDVTKVVRVVVTKH